jgi:hypothetical protein
MRLGSGGGRSSLTLSGYPGTLKFSKGTCKHMGSTYRQGCNSAFMEDEGHDEANKGGGGCGRLLDSRGVTHRGIFAEIKKYV